MPPFPAALQYIWHSYWRLRRRVGGNGYSALPIGWQDIDAFTTNTGARLAPWEVEIIEAIDDLFLNRSTPTEGT